MFVLKLAITAFTS